MKINATCPYCGKEILYFDPKKNEEVKITTLAKADKAREACTDIQYVQSNSKSPVQLFHESCWNKLIMR